MKHFRRQQDGSRGRTHKNQQKIDKRRDETVHSISSPIYSQHIELILTFASHDILAVVQPPTRFFGVRGSPNRFERIFEDIFRASGLVARVSAESNFTFRHVDIVTHVARKQTRHFRFSITMTTPSQVCVRRFEQQPTATSATPGEDDGISKTIQEC